jgi:hypothetical protein
MNATSYQNNMSYGIKNLLIITGKCHTSCATCTNTSINACTSCISGYALQLNGTCICNTTNYISQNNQCIPLCSLDQTTINYNNSCIRCDAFMSDCYRCQNTSYCI